MPYEVTDLGGGRYEVRDTTYDTGSNSADVLTVPAALLYLLGFIGMLIMLFNLPTTMIGFGVLAFLLYSLPLVIVVIALFMRPIVERDMKLGDTAEKEIKVEGSNVRITEHDADDIFDRVTEPFSYKMYGLLTRGGGVFKNILKNFIAPYAHVLFSLFLAIFWIGHIQGAMSEAAQIAFVIPCAYSMYYYPFVMIRNAVKRHSKAWGIAAAVVILLSFGVFLAFYDQLMALGGATGLALLFTALTVFGTLALLIAKVARSTKKGKHVAILLLYGLLLAAVIVAAAVIIPAQNAERYEAALQCVESGDYRAAREQLAALGGYQDAAERLEAIRFINLQVGERVVMGTQTDSPDDLYGENPITWTVVAVEDGKALLFCDAILTSIDSNPLSHWTQSNSVRNALGSLYGLFDEGEQARILPHTYTVETEKGETEVTDKLFLLSRAELERYCAAERIFAESDTTYNDHQVLDYQMADFDYTYIYAYYVRDVDDRGAWIVADCESDGFVSKGDAHRYVGLRPAVYITVDEAAPAE